MATVVGDSSEETGEGTAVPVRRTAATGVHTPPLGTEPELTATPPVVRRREADEVVVTLPTLVWKELLAGLAAGVSIQVNAPLLHTGARPAL
jgi:hypothetical protein